MNNKILSVTKLLIVSSVIAISSILGASAANASTVTRSFSTPTPVAGSSLTVSLTVSVAAPDTYYIIDEIFPTGWVVSSPGTGDTTQAGHIKWAVLSGAVSTVNTYTLTVPITASGASTFSGEFGFDTTPGTVATILGDTSVTVTAAPVLTTITVSPLDSTITVGATQQFTATTLDQNGAPISATVTWTLSDITIGTIDLNTGMFTTVAAGVTTISATSGSIFGTTTVTVNVAANPAKDITAFSFPEGVGVITGTNIAVIVPFGTDVTALIPTISLSGGTISPLSGVAQDFTNPVVYTVTAADNSIQTYTVTVTFAPNTAANILSFNSTTPVAIGVINGTNITLTVPFGTNLTDLPITISLSPGASVLPTAGNATFTDGVPTIYVVTAQDGATTQSYSVTVTVAPNTSKDITSFNFAGLSPSVAGVISGTNIILNVPYETNITNLVPTVGITGASVDPASGVAQDFTSPVTYTVTAADTTTQIYTVTVIVAQPSDLTALTAAIAAAQSKYDAAVEGNLPGQYPAPLKANLQTAINIASVITNTSAQSIVDAAVTTLNAAVATFEAGIVPAPNTTILAVAITSAQTLHDGAIEGTDPGQYAIGSKATLQTAIDAATAVKDNPASFQADVDAAVTVLNVAVTTFEAGKVPPPNNIPVANDQSVLTDKNVAKSIILTATDADSDSLTFSVIASPSHGTLSGTAPNLTYTPTADYIGSDSFTFKANDGKDDSNTATVSITVNDVITPIRGGGTFFVLSFAAPVNAIVSSPPIVTSPVQVVLGEKVFNYTDGTLLRGSDNKIYVVENGKLQHIISLKELAKYAEKEILKVDDDVIASYGKAVAGQAVLGVKVYVDGVLLRGSDHKIYIVENDKLKHIINLKELAKYTGQEILKVGDDVIASYGQAVLGVKVSANIDDLIASTKFGQRGDKIKQLQMELQNLGLMPRGYKVTDYYGPITSNAVTKYQANK